MLVDFTTGGEFHSAPKHFIIFCLIETIASFTLALYLLLVEFNVWVYAIFSLFYKVFREFGSFLLDGIVESTNLRNRGMKQSPSLHVLKNATMPAALIEMGFISNENDAKLLSESPELFAQGIYRGLLDYLNL